MKPCVCVVIVLFFIQSQDSGFVWLYSKTQKTQINNKATVFYFLFYGLSGPISNVGGRKTN